MSKPGKKLDLASFLGLVLAVGGILGGLVLEGGSVKDVAQVTAALIVLGGTLGATMISTPAETLTTAAKRLPAVFLPPTSSTEAYIDEIVGYAMRARKNGIVSLEQEAGEVTEPFLRKALNLAVDGTDPQEIRKMMDLEIAMQESRAEADAKVFESAGGYAPTIGIIGAVMGLIQVMKHLENIEEVGHGIAVAFVATIYGVGSANIFFLPIATKIKARARAEAHTQEMLLEGVVSLVEGLNPKLIRAKLEAFAHAPAATAGPAPPVRVEQVRHETA